MLLRKVYFVMFLAGAVIPYAAFVPWLLQHGLDGRLFVSELFANRISTFFALDLLLTAVVVISLARRARERLRAWWLPVAVTVLVGVSAGLPLLLYLEARAATENRKLGTALG